MTKSFRLLACLVVASLLLVAQEPARKGPPPTRVAVVKDTLHGVEIADPYRWLEDQNSPDTRAWIDAQNTYTQSIISKLPEREKLKQRLTELMKIDTLPFPQERNGRYFFSRRLKNQELSVIYVRKGLKGPDEVLLDPHPLSTDRSISVGMMSVSRDGTVLAYGVREGGQDEVTVKLLEVDTRRDLPDRLPKARYGSFSFKPDKSGFYYSRYGREGPKLFYHVMGQEVASDTQIFGQGLGPDKILGAGLSEDGRYLLLQVAYGAGGSKSEVYYQDVAGQGPIKNLVKDIDARFMGRIGGDQLFLQTNWKAPNGRIFAVDLKNPAQENWREIIPESKDAMQGFSLVGGKLFVSYLKDVVSRVRVFEPDGKHVRDIAFPVLGTVSGMSGRWSSNEGFFAFTSFHVPTTIYRYDVQKGAQEVFAKLEVPVDSDKLEVKQVWFESRDKTRVPMFLVHARGMKPDGARPTLMTGYGGFNSSSTPGFSSTAVLWAERGGVYAVVNLRGGGEFGEAWHKAGMLGNKQNVFDDFIAAAEWLIKNGYTNPSRLAITGGSNGGLLVGAAMTQRPDLFRAVVCSYPLLDMVRYQNFLVARFWVSEYGAAENPEQFKYLYAYSPYHRVKPGARYPAVMFVSGDGDTRVDPLHARKMAALVQSATASDRPVLLHYDTKAGHSGGLPLARQIEVQANVQSFLWWQLSQ